MSLNFCSRIRFLGVACVWAVGGLRLAGGPAQLVPFTIVAFGDSTTAARPGVEVYATQLERRFPPSSGVRILNKGFPGDSTALARKRFVADVLEAKPNLVIIQFGIDDAAIDVWKTPPAQAPRVSLADFEANLRYFIDAVRQAGGRVILMTPNPLRWTPKLVQLYGRPPYHPEDEQGLTRPLEAYVQVVRRLAAELQLPLVDVYALYAGWEKSHGQSYAQLLNDGMHPRTAGQVLVTEALAPVVSAALPAAKPAPFFETYTAIASDGGEFKMNSYPVAAALPDGRIFLTWEACDGNLDHTHIVGAFSRDDGRTWGRPETIIDIPLMVNADPAIILTPDEIQVYSTTRLSHPVRYSEMWKSSRQFDGTTWSRPIKMPAHHVYEVGKIHLGLTLADGTLVMPWGWDTVLERRKPIGAEKDLKLAASVLRSRDGGATWTPGGAMFANVSARMSPIATGGVGEPSMVLLPSGEIFALLRTSDRWLYQSRSRDGGLTWDQPTPSPLTGHNTPSALWRLRGTGEVLVVWNNSPLSRWPLDAALSTDGCRTWSPPKILSNTPGFHSSYAAATQAADGTLLAVWYQNLPKKNRELRMARFNRAWLLSPP